MKIRPYMNSIFLLFLGTQAFGLGNEEYAKRTGIAQQKLVAADQIKSAILEHEALRSRYMFSKDSLDKKASEVLIESTRWLSQWKLYLLGFERLDISNYEAFLSRSKEFFDSQSKALHEIELELETIRRVSVDANNNINFNYTSSAQLDEIDRTRVSQLRSAFYELKLSITRIDQNVRDQIGMLRLIQEKSFEALTLKVKRRLLAQSQIPVESGLARYRELVEETRILAPLKNQLEKMAYEMSRYSLNFAMQHAKKLRKEASSQCDSGRLIVNDSPLSDARKSSALSVISGLCSAINKSWETLLNSGLSEREMAFEYASLMKTNFESRCKSGDPSLDCREFQSVSAIPKEFYDTATDVELRDVEYRWSSIETLDR